MDSSVFVAIPFYLLSTYLTSFYPKLGNLVLKASFVAAYSHLLFVIYSFYLLKLRFHLCVMLMMNDIRGTSVVSPCARHVLLCDGPAYEGISSPTKHSHLDWSQHVAIHFVIGVLHIGIHISGSTPILILSFQFFVAFAFVIHIAHKWNRSLSAFAYRHTQLKSV